LQHLWFSSDNPRKGRIFALSHRVVCAPLHKPPTLFLTRHVDPIRIKGRSLICSLPPREPRSGFPSLFPAKIFFFLFFHTARLPAGEGCLIVPPCPNIFFFLSCSLSFCCLRLGASREEFSPSPSIPTTSPHPPFWGRFPPFLIRVKRIFPPPHFPQVVLHRFFSGLSSLRPFPLLNQPPP